MQVVRYRTCLVAARFLYGRVVRAGGLSRSLRFV
jgi:hypothetical protein